MLTGEQIIIASQGRCWQQVLLGQYVFIAAQGQVLIGARGRRRIVRRRNVGICRHEMVVIILKRGQCRESFWIVA
eukprot:scaffold1170_cov174-Amphora_coffeaeformis.AAC.18